MESPLDRLPRPDDATRRIYAYELNLPELRGRIKVGETTRSVHQRVLEQVNTAGLSDLVNILMDEPAITGDGRAFRDRDVHAALDFSGAQRVVNGGMEWFECSLDEVRTAYNSVVEGRVLSRGRDKSFGLRQEQRDAIAVAFEYFKRHVRDSVADPPRFLWNAKMRFGKTFAAYHLAKLRKDRRVLVVTYKPAVKSAWRDDLETHRDFDGWTFFARDSSLDPHSLSPESPSVCFASLQDLRGRLENGAIKRHNQWIHEQTWDLVIVDEYHFGAWNLATRELFAGEEQAGRQELAAELGGAGDDEPPDIAVRVGVDGRAFLCLSGTPFRAIASEDFGQDQIFNWTYTDEQERKAAYAADHVGEWSPYSALPQMTLLTYELPTSLKEIALKGDRNEFDLNAFFSASGGARTAEFEHKDQVQGWLDWVRGQDEDAVLRALSGGPAKPFPYADTNVLPYMNHSVWFLPDVAAVHAMKRLVEEDHNRPYWGQFDFRAVAGNGAGIGPAALPPVVAAIGSGFDTRTVTLTCSKLLTGVTVPQWSAILMLCNLRSPETYFQAAFRVQSPWSIWNPEGTNPNEERVVKPVCLVLDFAPNRALSLYADYGMRLGAGEDADQDVRDLNRFLPVLGFDGTRMESVDVEEIIDAAFAMNALDMNKLRMESGTLVNANRGLLGLLDEGTRAALRAVSGSGRASAGAADEIDLNETDEIQPTSRSDGDSGDGDEGDSAAGLELKLRFLSKRVNAFMYLSEDLERNLQQVLDTPELDLFEAVMELMPDDMGALVEVGLFNEQAMRLIIHQFRRADEAAHRYLGLDARARVDGKDPGER